MKHNWNRSAWCVGAMVLSLVTSARGEEPKTKEEHHGDAQHGTSEAGHGAKEAMSVPDNLGGLWSHIRQQRAELDGVIAANALSKVHVVAFEIRDLVKAMPGLSKELSADNRKKLQDSAGRVGDIAKLLDQYGDSGDAAKTKAEAARLDKLLTYIESLYPAGMLASTTVMTGPHGGAVAVADLSNRLELVAANGSLSLFVLDKANKPRSIDKLKATIEVGMGTKEMTAASLAAAADHFAGAVTIPKGGSVAVHIEVVSATETLHGHFVVTEKGAVASEGEEGEGHHAEEDEHAHDSDEHPKSSSSEHPH